MESTIHSHKNTASKHQVECLDALYDSYYRHIGKGGFLTIYGIFAIIFFSFFYSSVNYDVPIETRTFSSTIGYYFSQLFTPEFWFVLIPVSILIILIDRYIRFGNLPLDILSEHQLDYIKSDPTLSYYFRNALTKNMKINSSFFNDVYNYKSFLERQINNSIKFSQDEERAKKRQKAIDIAKSI